MDLECHAPQWFFDHVFKWFEAGKIDDYTISEVMAWLLNEKIAYCIEVLPVI